MIAKQKEGLFQSLNRLFEQGITVNHISEELQAVDIGADAVETKEMLITKDYDAIGVLRNGRILGYVKKEELAEGDCGSYLHKFETEELVSDSTPLLDILYLFEKQERVFILERNEVKRIVSLADLQKPPVRMLVFGMITLLESYITNIIVKHYHQDSWKESLSESRVTKSLQVFREKQKKNEALRLVECLQITDKFTVILKSRELRAHLNFLSREEAKTTFHKIEKLRNTLAHAHDLGCDLSWIETITVIKKIQELLEMCRGNSHGGLTMYL